MTGPAQQHAGWGRTNPGSELDSYPISTLTWVLAYRSGNTVPSAGTISAEPRAICSASRQGKKLNTLAMSLARRHSQLTAMKEGGGKDRLLLT